MRPAPPTDREMAVRESPLALVVEALELLLPHVWRRRVETRDDGGTQLLTGALSVASQRSERHR